jgi:hypothetical protein
MGQLHALAHLDMGGGDLEWIGNGKRQGGGGAGAAIVESIVSRGMKRLAVMQSHLTDSEIVSNSTHVQHPQRLLQVKLCFFQSCYCDVHDAACSTSRSLT